MAKEMTGSQLVELVRPDIQQFKNTEKQVRKALVGRKISLVLSSAEHPEEISEDFLEEIFGEPINRKFYQIIDVYVDAHFDFAQIEKCPIWVQLKGAKKYLPLNRLRLI